MFYAPLKIQRRCTHLKAIRPSNFKQAVWGFFPLSWNPDAFFSLPLFSFLFFLFSGAPVIVLCSYKGYGISKLLPRKVYGPLLPDTHQLSSILLPVVCFNSHLTADKRAVQSYSVTGGTTSRVNLPFPPLVPTKQAGDMWGRSSLLLLLILCSLTSHKWTNVFVCCFMRSHIRIPPWTLPFFVSARVILWSSTFLSHCITGAKQLQLQGQVFTEPSRAMLWVRWDKKCLPWEKMMEREVDEEVVVVRWQGNGV